MKAGTIATYCTTDTFWNKLRIDKGVTLKTIGRELGVDHSWLSRIFSGAVLPATPVAIKICDYFGVDYAEGAAQFNKIHEDYVANNQGKRKRSRIRSRKFDVDNVSTDTEPVQGPTVEISESEPESAPVTANLAISGIKQPTALVSAVLKQLYNNISYDDFMTLLLCDPSEKDLLEFAYGKVDYDTYYKLFLASLGITEATA